MLQTFKWNTLNKLFEQAEKLLKNWELEARTSVDQSDHLQECSLEGRREPYSSHHGWDRAVRETEWKDLFEWHG